MFPVFLNANNNINNINNKTFGSFIVTKDSQTVEVLSYTSNT